MRKKRMLWLAGLLAIYITVYFVWSRSSMAAARPMDSEGYYFLQNTMGSPFIVESLIRTIFWPCLLMDTLLGPGLPPACAPLNDLSSSTTTEGRLR